MMQMGSHGLTDRQVCFRNNSSTAHKITFPLKAEQKNLRLITGGSFYKSNPSLFRYETIDFAKAAAAARSFSLGLPLWIPLNSPLQWNSR